MAQLVCEHGGELNAWHAVEDGNGVDAVGLYACGCRCLHARSSRSGEGLCVGGVISER